MARKYTNVTFIGDEARIKAIIKECRPELRFIKFSYVRDDRIVDLTKNKVYIGDHPEANWGNMDSCYRHGGVNLAYANLKEAHLDGMKLIGTRVEAELADSGNIEFALREYEIMDLEYGSFNFNYCTIEQVIEIFSTMPELQDVANGLRMVVSYYNTEEHTISWYAKMWWIIDHYNLYDLMDEYSNLFTYHSELYLDRNDIDFFKSAKIAPEFKFRLSNYYLPMLGNSNGRSIHPARTSSYLYAFFTKLPKECQNAFIEGAMKERYDILSLVEVSYVGDEVAQIASTAPEFFCDYMLKAKTHENHESILNSFRREATALKNRGMTLTYANLSNLKFEQKAHAMNCSVADFFHLVENLDTKEGIIEYLRQSTID